MAGQGLFDPRVAVASLSGESDADWARAAAAHVGCAFLGGIAIDDTTRDAARRMVDRDREEFLPPDPVAFLERQLESLSDVPVRPAVNLRSATLKPVTDVARLCRRHSAIVEINAHCRQDEMCAVGAGESLLRSPTRLSKQVATAAATDVDVSVKVRAEVDGVDLPRLAGRLERAGADAIHVDAMDTESIVGDVVDATDCFVVANNGVRDRETTVEYLDQGADAVSVGRPSDDPAVLGAVRRATDACFAEATP